LERLGKRSCSSTPDAQFAVAESTFIFDHLTRKVYFAVAPIFPGAKTDLIEIIEGIDPEDDEAEELEGELIGAGDPDRYMKGVLRSKEHIMDGDIFQVVLARSAKVRCTNPVGLYRRLRRINPSPYTYLFEFGDLSIVGASPETLFCAFAGKLKVNPIAGTCPRGKTAEEDDALARVMLEDEKERAEHVMLVDLGRNDVRSVCRSGTVRVEDFMSVLRYSHVQHIETTVVGSLREECDQFDAATLSLSCWYPLRCTQVAGRGDHRRAGGGARGLYGGGIGYFSVDGSADFAIAIRSILLQNDVATVQAGAGIVADSDPLREYQETERKMAAMKSALGVAK